MSKEKLTRRQFVTAAAALPGLAALSQMGTAASWLTPAVAAAPPAGTENAGAAKGFSFVLLGDIHFDRLEHHDMEWLAKEHAGDVRQVQNYSRITSEIHPRLFSEVRDTVAELQKSSTPPAFVIQAGDVVEGLCGTPALAQRQCEEAVSFFRDAKLSVPLLYVKGNHDITGPGATEAFNKVLLPFTLEQAPDEKDVSGANYTVEHEGSLFAFCDAYERSSLEWLEKTLAARSARNNFVIIHPPVVPYNARSLWHLYSSAKQTAERERLLKVLGEHHALALTGHIHKNSVLARQAPGGRFGQLAVTSIFNKPEVDPKNRLTGIENYGPDLVAKTEPNFSPKNEAERRASLEAEKPFVKSFEYADAPGYAVITVTGTQVQAKLFSGLGRRQWETLDLGALPVA